MLYLNVPFSEKDEAKALFAKWDARAKKWYADNPKYYYKYARWIDGHTVFCHTVNIAESTTSCWRCKNETKVFAFAVESKNISDLRENKPTDVEAETGFDLFIWSIADDIPPQIKKILENDFGCKTKFSKTIQDYYFANTCSTCDSLQGDFFLHSEPESPFGHLSKAEIILHSIELSQDMPSLLYINQDISPAIRLLERSKFIKTSYILGAN